jgi:hypothetical protein
MKQMTESNKPLAWLLASLTAFYAVAFRLLPYETTAWMLWPFTAFGLYAGARLRWWQSLMLVLGVQAGTDVILFAVNQWPASPGAYLSFAVFVLLGRGLLGHSHAPARLFAGATIGYAVFFLVTNTISWFENSLPEYQVKSFDTLMLAYREGLEFIRARPMQVFGQYAMVAVVFGAHAVLAKRWFPAEVIQPETVR